MVLGYHVTFGAYGFWLPNDPRGSSSLYVGSEELRRFGPATYVEARWSVAGKPHDRHLRRAAKKALKYPEVVFTGHQALAIARGFGEAVKKSGFLIWACAILPCHIHLVIGRHRYKVEQIVNLLKGAATTQLLTEGLHPLAEYRTPNDDIPTPFEEDRWKVFLNTPAEIRDKIAYVENNPVKEGKRRQRWPFVVPFDEGQLRQRIRDIFGPYQATRPRPAGGGQTPKG